MCKLTDCSGPPSFKICVRSSLNQCKSGSSLISSWRGLYHLSKRSRAIERRFWRMKVTDLPNTMALCMPATRLVGSGPVRSFRPCRAVVTLCRARVMICWGVSSRVTRVVLELQSDIPRFDLPYPHLLYPQLRQTRQPSWYTSRAPQSGQPSPVCSAGRGAACCAPTSSVTCEEASASAYSGENLRASQRNT